MSISLHRINKKNFLVCKSHSVYLWFCPVFLFVLNGIVIIAAMISVYLFGSNSLGPDLIVLIVSVIAAFFLIIAYLVTSSFNRIIEINQIQSEFVSVVSHELRSPLNLIKWPVEMLLKKIKEGSVSIMEVEYLKIIERNVSKMIDLINELLDISRWENNDFYFKKITVDLKEVVEEVVKNLQPLVEERKIKLKFEFEDDGYPVLSDPDKVKIVLKNLIDNAVKYSFEGGTVLIRIKHNDHEGVVYVEDKGIGIPLAQQKYIFRKFYRADNVMKYRTEGIGLGLFISKMIIEKLGGKIDFESQEGKGSVFWFSLPLVTKIKK